MLRQRMPPKDTQFRGTERSKKLLTLPLGLELARLLEKWLIVGGCNGIERSRVGVNIQVGGNVSPQN